MAARSGANPKGGRTLNAAVRGRRAGVVNRPTTGCSAVASTQTWVSDIDASPDGHDGYGSTIRVGLANSSNVLAADYFYLALER